MTVFNTGYATIDEAWGDISGKKKKKKVTQDPVCDLYEMKGNSSSYSETDLVNYNYDKSRYQRTYKDTPEVKNIALDDNYGYNSSSNAGGNSGSSIGGTMVPTSLFEKQFEVRHPQSFEMECPTDYMVKQTKNKLYDDTDDNYSPEPRQRSPPQGPHQGPPHGASQAPPPMQYSTQTQPKERFYNESDDEINYLRDDQPVRSDLNQRARYNKQESRYIDEKEDDSSDEDEYYERKNSKAERKNKSKTSLVYLDIILYILSGIILIFLLEQFVRIGINMQMV